MGRDTYFKGPETVTITSSYAARYYGPRGTEGQQARRWPVEIQTWCHPTKGWAWRVIHRGETLARSAHHVPLELLAMQAAIDNVQHVYRKIAVAALPDEVIRADKWKEDARRRSASLSPPGTKRPRARRPARLECGHIHMVRPGVRLGSDQVACGACQEHRTVAEFVEEHVRQ